MSIRVKICGLSTPETVAAAVDAGCELPTVTDGFVGDAPDLGAYELGKPLPLYGPRRKQ